MEKYLPLSRMDLMIRKESLRYSPRPSLAETSDEDISVLTEDTAWNQQEPFAPIEENECSASENRSMFLAVLEKQLREGHPESFKNSQLDQASPSVDNSAKYSNPSTIALSRQQESLIEGTPSSRSESHSPLAPISTRVTAEENRKSSSGTEAFCNTQHRRSSKPKRSKRHFKNFVLLLQPETKHFELIEIRYKTSTATIGDLLNMIPERSTISELRTQTYTGFVHPKNGVEFTNIGLMATGSYGSANLEHHDVLVAITKGYTGVQLTEFSEPILATASLPEKRHTSKLAKAVSSITKVVSRNEKKGDSHPKSQPSDKSLRKESRLTKTKKMYHMNFVLLLQPKTKSFELIEIRYEAATATVADLIKMIPERATVLTLGVQKYRGFFRPRDEVELSNLSLKATGSDSAGIQNHEILVAITEGYTGAKIIKYSKPILANPSVVKLIAKLDPVSASTPKSQSDRLKANKHQSKSKFSLEKESRIQSLQEMTKVPVTKMEARGQSPQQQVDETRGSHKAVANNRTPQQAATGHARVIHTPRLVTAARNSKLATRENQSPRQAMITKSSYMYYMDRNRVYRPVHMEKCSDILPPLTPTDSREDSSLSSGSFNPATNYVKVDSPVVPTKKRLSRRQRAKRNAVMVKMAAIAICFLMTRYLSDKTPHDVSADGTLGAVGLGQFVILFVGLVMMQRYVNQGHGRTINCCSKRKMRATYTMFEIQ